MESKLTEDKTPIGCSDLQIPGYASPYRKARTSHGGGIIVWAKTELAGRVVETDGHEVLWYTVKQTNSKHVIMCATYHPPSTDDTSVADYADKSLPELRRRGEAVILLGDFNWHSESWLGSNKPTDSAVQAEGVFASHGLEQMDDLPMRGENTLDLILTDIHTSRIKVSDREPLGKSDHCVLIADVALNLASEPRTTRIVWDYGKADLD